MAKKYIYGVSISGMKAAAKSEAAAWRAQRIEIIKSKHRHHEKSAKQHEAWRIIMAAERIAYQHGESLAARAKHSTSM